MCNRCMNRLRTTHSLTLSFASITVKGCIVFQVNNTKVFLCMYSYANFLTFEISLNINIGIASPSNIDHNKTYKYAY